MKAHILDPTPSKPQSVQNSAKKVQFCKTSPEKSFDQSVEPTLKTPS